MNYSNDNNGTSSSAIPQKTSSKFGQWLKTSLTARLVMVGFLTLVLLIPLSYINSLIRERAARQTNVIHEINSKWGEHVMVYGPLLKLPYKSYSEKRTYNEKTKTHTTEIETKLKHA
jgi:inner membrane protein